MNNRRAILFLLLSISSGLVTMYAFRTCVQSSQPTMVQVEIQTSPVVVAGIGLPAGIAIETIQLDVKQWPTQLLPPGVFPGKQLVDQRIPLHNISPGEPVLATALLPEGKQPGLDALIETNYRAMSVQVDAVVGVAGFIRPGSHVDVLATLRELQVDRAAVPYSRTILQNAKVLAVDQTLTDTPGNEAEIVSVVTLQVTPEEAQILTYGAAQGKLQLALRNPIDQEFIALRSTQPRDLMDEVITVKKARKKKVTRRAPRKSIEIIRGSNSSREYL